MRFRSPALGFIAGEVAGLVYDAIVGEQVERIQQHGADYGLFYDWHLVPAEPGTVPPAPTTPQTPPATPTRPAPRRDDDDRRRRRHDRDHDHDRDRRDHDRDRRGHDRRHDGRRHDGGR
ncbi:hypothetical protein [Streptomyces leeuwenhoekii]|uniref:hypothetical protein n=1 Tax=Streptomyces leeuwenhoekii TaxID=1437453 RepID=UPI00049481BA|nr:hypothetical protein [Streptomyces leeuwenhoekii]